MSEQQPKQSDSQPKSEPSRELNEVGPATGPSEPPASGDVVATTEMPAKPRDGIDEIRTLRGRMLPMFKAIADEFSTRSQPGYPLVFDNIDGGGYFGILLDPSYGLYIMTDGESVFAQLNILGWRTDVRSSAQKEKFSNVPFTGTVPMSTSLSDNALRNLISELLASWNTQPQFMNQADS